MHVTVSLQVRRQLAVQDMAGQTCQYRIAFQPSSSSISSPPVSTGWQALVCVLQPSTDSVRDAYAECQVRLPFAVDMQDLEVSVVPVANEL